MNNVERYSLCVKIILFLDNAKQLSQEELLYLVSLSDFYGQGDMESKNVKNINSLKVYGEQITDSILFLIACSLIVVIGGGFTLSATGRIFAEKLNKNEINLNLISKIKYTFNLFGSQGNLENIYDNLVGKFIKDNVRGDLYEN